MPANRIARVLLATALALPLPTAVLAQSVFFTGPDNQINSANFDDGTVATVVTRSGSNFRGLAVREDGLLIVANGTQGGAVLACDSASGGCGEIASLSQAEGVDLGPTGTLFAVNADPGGQDTVIAALPRGGCPAGIGSDDDCLPGGYDRASGAVVIDADVGRIKGNRVRLLADVKVAPFRQGAFTTLNSIAVLSQDPPLLLVYDTPEHDDAHGGGVHSPWEECNGICTPRIVIPTDDFEGREPRGFDFDAENHILVSTKDGTVLRFDPSGNRVDDFALLPGAGAKLGVGIEEENGVAVTRTFVVVKNNGILQRYTGGGGAPVEITNGVNSPEGIAISTSTSFAFAPTGPSTVNVGGLVTTWENVSVAGTAVALCTNVADPRNGNDVPLYLSCAMGQPCVVPDLGLEVMIPSYARAYPTLLPGDDPDIPSGPPTFRICKAELVGGAFDGLVFDEAQEEVYLGYDPAHPPGSPNMFHCDNGPRFYYATLPGENPMPETPMAFDTSITCGRNLQGFFQRSILIPNVFETRDLDGEGDVASAGGCTANDGAVDCKLNILQQVFDSGGKCVGNPVRKKTEKALDKAISAFDKGDYVGAQEHLCSFEDMVDGNAAKFSKCESTYRDHLRARVKSANFILGLLSNPGETSELVNDPCSAL